MDFRNRSYYLICKLREPTQTPKYIKRYFNCKIHCKHYCYNDEIYTICVSIDKSNSDKLINYFKDKRIKFMQIKESMERVNSYTLKYETKKYKKQKENTNKSISYYKNLFDELENLKSMNEDYQEMIDFMTKILNIDTIVIGIAGYDKEGHRVNLKTSNKDFMYMLNELCRKTIDKYKLY